jgi:phosphomannomutase
MTAIKIQDLMQQSGVGFGTSGARGLVTQMTDKVCFAYTLGFLQHVTGHDGKKPEAVAIAGDLRPSTQRIMLAIAEAAESLGIKAINCGEIPSPAVALHGIEMGLPAIMVTGSHIPDDRNGIKFNTATGEITKQDEQSIREQVVEYEESQFNADGMFATLQQLPETDNSARDAYFDRYVRVFGSDALNGMTVGIYEHTSVARDLLVDLFIALGAETISLGRSDKFIPVDTEAIRPEDIELAKGWAAAHHIDAIVSTDGDADRPLVSDENGTWLRGDAIGALCARQLGAKYVVTPVSSNTAVELSGWFDSVVRTRIGSPFVIEGMQQLTDADRQAIIGYEANGGFLIQDQIVIGDKTLNALPTRDAVIVMLALLRSCKEQGIKMSQLAAQLPERYTYSDRIKEVPQDKSAIILTQLQQGDDAEKAAAVTAFFDGVFGDVKSINQTDGLRITFDSGQIVHIRPSGNAPELRCYTEADTLDAAVAANTRAMEFIRNAVDTL